MLNIFHFSLYFLLKSSQISSSYSDDVFSVINNPYFVRREGGLHWWKLFLKQILRVKGEDLRPKIITDWKVVALIKLNLSINFISGRPQNASTVFTVFPRIHVHAPDLYTKPRQWYVSILSLKHVFLGVLRHFEPVMFDWAS